MTHHGGVCCVGRQSHTKSAHAVPSSFEPRTTPVAFLWRRLDGGEFRMGSSDQRFPEDGEGPVRTVRINAFAIAAHTLTNMRRFHPRDRLCHGCGEVQLVLRVPHVRAAGGQAPRPQRTERGALVVTGPPRLLGPARRSGQHDS